MLSQHRVLSQHHVISQHRVLSQHRVSEHCGSTVLLLDSAPPKQERQERCPATGWIGVPISSGLYTSNMFTSIPVHPSVHGHKEKSSIVGTYTAF